MSSKLKDKEPKSLLENKVFQAGIIVSIILLSSAVFVSQTDRIFGKAAAGGPITGTMILIDHPTTIIGDMEYRIFLPKETCTGQANVCYGDTPTSAACRSIPLVNVNGEEYSIPIGDVLMVQEVSCSGGGTETLDFDEAIPAGAKFAYLSLNGYEWCTDQISGEISITSPIADISMGYPGSTCIGHRSVSKIIDVSTNDRLEGSIKVVCSGGSTRLTGKVIVQRKLPEPLFHLSVAYKC